MIGRLFGKIIEKTPPLLILDVNGVGYEVFSPLSTFYNLPDLNQNVQLLTHMIVREDAMLLYGFSQARERALFRSLIKVSGVGPKLALTILSGIEPDQFVTCIQQNDASSLINIPGIGKKTAERLMIEMRDALAKWELSIPTTDNQTASTTQTISQQNNIITDAISALTALGYKPNDAKRMINKVYAPNLNSEALIRLALQKMTVEA